MNRDLINTNWLLIDSVGGCGWTIYAGAILYPGDFLGFRDTDLFNRNFREVSHLPTPQSYSLSDTAIRLDDHTWEISQLTQDALVISYLGNEFHYRKISLPGKKQSEPEVISRLIGERWRISNSTDFASNVSLFLEQGFDETEDFLAGYSILLTVEYDSKIMSFPASHSTIYAWKIICVEGICFLSLFDVKNSFRNLQLVSVSEEEMLFQGKQAFRLVKQNKHK